MQREVMSLDKGKNLPPCGTARPVAPDVAAGGPVYQSRSLLQGGTVAWIEHERERYMLRLTRQGKLILTK